VARARDNGIREEALIRMLRRAADILREDGFRALVFRVLGETVYRRVLVVEIDPSGALARPDRRCGWLMPDDVRGYARLHAELPEEEIRRRLAEGQRCFVVRSDAGEIVSGVWVAFGCARVDYVQTCLPLKPDEAYLYQSYTAVTERRQGLSTTAYLAVSHALRQEGYARMFGCLQPDRAIGYGPVMGSGSAPRAYLGWVGIGRWRRMFNTPTGHYPQYAPRPDLT
jgi:hypothetical protein